MPVDTPRVPAGKAKGKGKGKGFRIGPYNGYVVLAGVGAAILIGLYLRNKLGSSSTSGGTTTQPPDQTGAGTGSGGGASGGSGTDYSGQLSQIDADINALAAQLAAGQFATAPTAQTGPLTDASGQVLPWFQQPQWQGDTLANYIQGPYPNGLAKPPAPVTSTAHKTHKAASIPEAPHNRASVIEPGSRGTVVIRNGRAQATTAAVRRADTARTHIALREAPSGAPRRPGRQL